ncbi:uncharacterized protein C21orf62 homolog [Suricata suricatta]|uniref:Chromosome 21 open reading frame 62 n=1 Tax=Suricata suricatta TaxID=37032 RepID=A0A673SRA3_SURSU|nr:uncharacterized protein C21orf62 homolog [Suricata suricatta]XP_029794903.1 uncharacterized protein C21orf62 homolog [Suricata suricatta]
MAPRSGPGLLLTSALGILVLDCVTGGQKTSTLIFTKENTIRNCSCPADVWDCDYSLANLMCSCNTVLPAAVEQASYSDRLTVWFTDASALGLLLNFTLVRDLKLSLCSPNTLPSQYLAICGLRRLRIRAEARWLVPEQSLLIDHSREGEPRENPVGFPGGWQMCMYVSFLDMALFNRKSSLKAYSIENVANTAKSFPHFSYFEAFPILSNKSYVVTFIY